jgi:UDP-N-acetylmuramoylalanine-D-glutamate ligase
MGMKASAKKGFSSDSFAGKRIAVLGIGQVGMHLVEYLVKERAAIFIADLRMRRRSSQEAAIRLTEKRMTDVGSLQMSR